MFRRLEIGALALVFCAPCPVYAVDDYPGIGREATATETRAWDIDVRADFEGLPEGAGSASRGKDLYAAQCAACHGRSGDSSSFSPPLIGGTTPHDIREGRVRALADPATAGLSMIMQLPTLSTLFDYIQRAMPWEAPKSLQPDDVYALIAYLLSLADIVPEEFTLSNQNVFETQNKLPNRHGMTTDHGLWPGAAAVNGGMGNGGISDVQAELCMQDCAPAHGE